MATVEYLLLPFCLLINSIDSLIVPTYTNGTTDYYITSQSTSFSDEEIVCSSETCIIICNNSGYCSSTTINASLSKSLTLECSEYRSCYFTNIIKAPSTTVNIQCLWDSACGYATFGLQNTPDILINCSNRHCISDGICAISNASCYYTKFYTQYSTNVYADCAKYGCARAAFHFDYVNTATLSTMNYGIFKANVYAAETLTSLTIYCDSTDACRVVNIYCPINGICNIDCSFSGTWICYGLDIFIPTKDSNLNLLCALATTCEFSQVFCDDTNTNTLITYSENSDTFVCDNDYCCPETFLPSETFLIECPADLPCFVDCTTYGGCLYKTIINGTHASSLTLHCDNNYECQDVDVKCPNNGECNLNCLGDYSCEFINIISETIASFNLLCVNTWGCRYIDIALLVVMDNVNITCIGNYGCRYIVLEMQIYGDKFDLLCTEGNTACRYMDFVIDVMSDITEVTIFADAETTLFKSDIIINNANIVNINCISINDNRPCQGVDFIANNINLINILCSSSKSCWQSNWDLTAKDIIFLCDGSSSCQDNDIDVDINNSISLTTTYIDGFTDSSITVFCWECINVYNCLENITIFCGMDVSPSPINTDDECRNCLCDVTADNPTIIPFNNGIWEQCIPTQYPTPDPTEDTDTPTNDPTSDPSIDPTSDPTTIPTINPTTIPTFDPTMDPTLLPTITPTVEPTFNPTKEPVKEQHVGDTTSSGSIQQSLDSVDDGRLDNDISVLIKEDMVIIIIVAGFCCIICGACCYVYRKKRKRLKDKRSDNINSNIINGEQNLSAINMVMTAGNKSKDKVMIADDTDSENENEYITKGNNDDNGFEDNDFIVTKGNDDDNNNLYQTKGNEDEDISEQIMNALDVENDPIIIGEDESTSGNINDDEFDDQTPKQNDMNFVTDQGE